LPPRQNQEALSECKLKDVGWGFGGSVITRDRAALCAGTEELVLLKIPMHGLLTNNRDGAQTAHCTAGLENQLKRSFLKTSQKLFQILFHYLLRNL